MDFIYNILEAEKEKLLVLIKQGADFDKKYALIKNKNIIEYSLSLLKKCEEFDIKPESIFTKLPVQTCQSPSSEYRIMEDCETEDRKWWIEARIKDQPFDRVRLHQGDVVIET